MPSVFLSYSSKDKEFTRRLAERLVQANVKVWLDEVELNIGDSLMMRISAAIESTDFVAVVLSHRSVQSSWVQSELQMAMTRELADRKVRVLPIVIEPCKLPMFLQDKLYADFSNSDDFDAPFARILRALGVDQKIPSIAPPVTPVVAEKKVEGEVHQEFLDIKIIGIDKDRTHNPNPRFSLFNIYLTLSEHPPQKWTAIFEEKRRFLRHSMWRRAWIEGNNAVVYCVPDELKQYHLRDLKEDVAAANIKYRGYLQLIEVRRADEAHRQSVQRRVLDSVLDDLDL